MTDVPIERDAPMQYDKNRYTIWTVRHPLIWFWVLFPETILNELILGQRIPQGYLVLRFLCDLWEKSGIGVPSYRGSVGSENLKFRKTKSSCTAVRDTGFIHRCRFGINASVRTLFSSVEYRQQSLTHSNISQRILNLQLNSKNEKTYN